MDKATVADVKACAITAKWFRETVEADVENRTPVEMAAALRIAVVLEAAEKMADAIEERSDCELDAAAEAFRKAMRGEL